MAQRVGAGVKAHYVASPPKNTKVLMMMKFDLVSLASKVYVQCCLCTAYCVVEILIRYVSISYCKVTFLINNDLKDFQLSPFPNAALSNYESSRSI